MAHRHLKVSMNVKVWFEYLLLFSLVFYIHLGLGSTAKRWSGPWPPGHISGNTQIWFSCLVGSGVFDKTIIWIPHMLEFH